MNNIETMLFLTWILMALSGVLAYRTWLTIYAWIEMRRRRKEYASLEKAHEEDSCKEGHKWDKTKLALQGLDVGVYTVCVSCGYVSGTNYRLNAPGLQIYTSIVARRLERATRWNHALRLKTERSQEIMNQLIKQNVAKFEGDMQYNIVQLQDFFRKANLELDVLYASLNKNLDEEDNG